MKRILAVLLAMLAVALVVGLVVMTQRGMFTRAETLPTASPETPPEIA